MMIPDQIRVDLTALMDAINDATQQHLVNITSHWWRPDGALTIIILSRNPDLVRLSQAEVLAKILRAISDNGLALLRRWGNRSRKVE